MELLNSADKRTIVHIPIALERILSSSATNYSLRNSFWVETGPWQNLNVWPWDVK